MNESTVKMRQEVREHLDHCVFRLRRAYWFRQTCIGLFIACLFAATSVLINGPLSLLSASIIAFVTVLVWLALQMLRGGGEGYNLNNLLLHINDLIPSAQRSAELVTLPVDVLTDVQKIQQKRMFDMLFMRKIALTTMVDKKVHYLGWYVALSACLYGVYYLSKYYPYAVVEALGDEVELVSQDANRSEWKASLRVTPPNYTQQPVTEHRDLDVTVLEGSKVEWLLTDLDPTLSHDNWVLKLDQAVRPFVLSENNTLHISRDVYTSGLYVIGHNRNGEFSQMTDVHTLDVVLDERPTIRILTPEETVTEFAMSSEPVLVTEVDIFDDYGVVDAFLQVSIAKGSGEAVKFRDQKIQFDSFQTLVSDNVKPAIQQRYQKQWDLVRMGMEPGDELYFTVIAQDNRTPERQLARSTTKVIKWLDEDVDGVSSDGIVMDVMPEYFKSQRQIIIETIALIESEPQISKSQFDQISRALGGAQSDLKHRYGQYLGDEFETGVMQTMEQGPDHDHQHDSHNHDHEENEQTEENDDEQHAGHEHEEEYGASQDLSGYAEVIEQFGHNHGEADIGFISLKKGQFSPKVLMKQAIANMWQAELFLQLSQPQQALPFENKALEFLERARKADRVYLKRLGFEPPPVSEERRYQGDLRDISALKRVQESTADEDKNAYLSELLTVLADIQNRQDRQMSENEIQSLTHIQRQMQSRQREQQDPLRLQAMARLQRMLVAQNFAPENCMDCVELLRAYSWQHSPLPKSAPRKKMHKASDNHPSVMLYRQTLTGME